MDPFSAELTALFADFPRGRHMVLSTASRDGQVSSRMMSIILLDSLFYFQTDNAMRKYALLTSNPHAALCADNLQIEGVCEELGHPLSHPGFCAAYQACFPGSYARYTNLSGERLFVIRPTFIQRWLYREEQPFVETFDYSTRRHQLTAYTPR